jgi:hypothetical protein
MGEAYELARLVLSVLPKRAGYTGIRPWTNAPSGNSRASLVVPCQRKAHPKQRTETRILLEHTRTILDASACPSLVGPYGDGVLERVWSITTAFTHTKVGRAAAHF